VTDRAIGDKWLVSSGLKEGDQLVVDGQQSAKPGAKVKVVPWSPKATVASAGTASGTN
jgi:membrane fusion protein (multidrug efflux system)